MAYLRYYLNAEGKREYTLKKFAPDGQPTLNAHPAKYTPDEEEEVTLARVRLMDRYGLMPAAKAARAKAEEAARKQQVLKIKTSVAANAAEAAAHVGIFGGEGAESIISHSASSNQEITQQQDFISLAGDLRQNVDHETVGQELHRAAEPAAEKSRKRKAVEHEKDEEGAKRSRL